MTNISIQQIADEKNFWRDYLPPDMTPMPVAEWKKIKRALWARFFATVVAIVTRKGIRWVAISRPQEALSGEFSTKRAALEALIQNLQGPYGHGQGFRRKIGKWEKSVECRLRRQTQILVLKCAQKVCLEKAEPGFFPNPRGPWLGRVYNKILRKMNYGLPPTVPLRVYRSLLMEEKREYFIFPISK